MKTYSVYFESVEMMVEAIDEDHATLIAEQEMANVAMEWGSCYVN